MNLSCFESLRTHTVRTRVTHNKPPKNICFFLTFLVFSLSLFDDHSSTCSSQTRPNPSKIPSTSVWLSLLMYYYYVAGQIFNISPDFHLIIT
ncbi:hypothetical protein M426DRAFT_158676 [Hypoxylon sp. CI-4A]|nr:hypothetical protein M426DRAFT_158676 [Hypoxylon sp. CI-4A]